MKKLIAAVVVALSVAVPAQAYTFYQYGVLMGTVCRSGYVFTNYPSYMAQPVGSTCPVRDAYGNFYAYGVVTSE